MVGCPDFNWIQTVIPAAAGLLGVWVGGWSTSKNQEKERQNQRIREQLEGLYGPLLAMRMEIKAKSELRVKVQTAGSRAWSKKLDDLKRDSAALMAADIAGPPENWTKVIDYNKDQLLNELIPLYRKMFDHLKTHLWLAEPSTLAHFDALVEYIEIWNRGLAQSLPMEVLDALDHNEKKLYPLYEDLQQQVERLRTMLKG